MTAVILEVLNFGIYGQALMNKQEIYWPRNEPSDFIDGHFNEKDIG